MARTVKIIKIVFSLIDQISKNEINALVSVTQ